MASRYCVHIYYFCCQAKFSSMGSRCTFGAWNIYSNKLPARNKLGLADSKFVCTQKNIYNIKPKKYATCEYHVSLLTRWYFSGSCEDNKFMQLFIFLTYFGT